MTEFGSAPVQPFSGYHVTIVFPPNQVGSPFTGSLQ
ncbi:hypothetical protein RRG08_049000, partial [Elysia crispata]